MENKEITQEHREMAEDWRIGTRRDDLLDYADANCLVITDGVRLLPNWMEIAAAHKAQEIANAA
jgi:hypothetical protein